MLNRLHVGFVFDCEHEDGNSRVELCFGENLVEGRTHPLKLPRNPPRVLFGRITDYDKVRSSDFDPRVNLPGVRFGQRDNKS